MDNGGTYSYVNVYLSDIEIQHQLIIKVNQTVASGAISFNATIIADYETGGHKIDDRLSKT